MWAPPHPASWTEGRARTRAGRGECPPALGARATASAGRVPLRRCRRRRRRPRPPPRPAAGSGRVTRTPAPCRAAAAVSQGHAATAQPLPLSLSPPAVSFSPPSPRLFPPPIPERAAHSSPDVAQWFGGDARVPSRGAKRRQITRGSRPPCRAHALQGGGGGGAGGRGAAARCRTGRPFGARGCRAGLHAG